MHVPACKSAVTRSPFLDCPSDSLPPHTMPYDAPPSGMGIRWLVFLSRYAPSYLRSQFVFFFINPIAPSARPGPLRASLNTHSRLRPLESLPHQIVLVASLSMPLAFMAAAGYVPMKCPPVNGAIPDNCEELAPEPQVRVRS